MATRDPHNAQLKEAYGLLKRGNREQALAILYSVVTNAPLHRDAWWLIAHAATQIKQKQQAVQRVLQIDPTHEKAREMAATLGMEVPAAPSYQPPYPPATRTAGQQPAAQPAQQPRPAPQPIQVVREREVVYVDRASGQLQPLLVLNGGLTSGCFSLVLTLIVSSVLAFLLIGGTISTALQEVGALAAGQSASVGLIPSIAATAFLTYLRSNPFPIDLSGLVGWISGVTGGNLILPDPASIYDAALRGLWNAQGYPAATGDRILARLGELGPQLSAAGWLVPLIFLGLWVLLAFLFVFLRARSNRLLHWVLSTIGLWFATGAAIVLGVLLFQLLRGGP